MEAAEIKKEVQGLDVGNWQPRFGLGLKDDLFPHVKGGLRGRTIEVTSVDVSLGETNPSRMSTVRFSIM